MERPPAPSTGRSDGASDASLLAWERLHGEPFDRVKALAFHLRARAALEHALARLDEAGIPALVVKGALLAHTLYASPIERPIRDVDLRVRPVDLARAGRILAGAPGAKALVRSRVYGSWVVSFERVELDLESAIGPPFVCGIPVEAILARAQRTTEGLGFPHWRPEIHDHALLLIVNLFKDRFLDVPPWKLGDLVRLVRAPGFDPATFHERVREAECTTVAHVVANVVATLAESREWEEMAARIVPARRRYAARILSDLGVKQARPALWRRISARACADSRSRALAALGASGLHEIERRLNR
jgi:hypothetical protein